jgi:citrate lyase beta subunit
MIKVHELIGRYGLLTGYIFPKFDMSNGREYFERLVSLGDGLYAMPIIESAAVADCIVRRENLGEIKSLADSYRDRILNIRVGGNDFCNLYGVRRSVSQTIYEAGTVRDILVDILNVFGGDYVVSAPVWEYFGEDEKGNWATGLKKEMAQDRLNGFVGKTAIHPYQLPVIDRAMRPSESDFKDAERILSWSGELAVGRGEGRMNEVKCHLKWAERTALLGEIYGVAEE